MRWTVRVLLVAMVVAAITVSRPVMGQNADSARTLIERAAAALGGLERVRASGTSR